MGLGWETGYTFPTNPMSCHPVKLQPQSQVYESWVKAHFLEAHWQECSVTFTGLPNGRDQNYNETRKFVMTMNGLLPLGHRGLIAVKFRWHHWWESGKQKFSGQAFTLWSSSFLARHACQMEGLMLRHDRPVWARISDDPFKFTSQNPKWADSCRHGSSIWVGLEGDVAEGLL